MLDKKTIKELLFKHQADLYHNLGQNYLIQKHSIDNFVRTFPTTEHIIEIGPGIGTITIHYASLFKKVTLLEKDEEKIPILKEVLQTYLPSTEHIQIIHTDALTFDYSEIATSNYQIVGALPYNIAKRLIYNTIHLLPPPTQLSFIVQKEVADKYVLAPPDESFISVSSKLYGTLNKKEIIHNDAFMPKPKVESRILTITKLLTKDQETLQNLDRISTIIKRGFNHPRKKLQNNIGEIKNTLYAQKRPQELSIDDWMVIDDLLRNQGKKQ